MSQKKCVGCGIELQNENPDKQGYTPKKINEKEEIYCQRCFQLKHYGKYTTNKMTREDYRKEVNNLLDKVELVLPVFDIIDFEGSFDVEILDILREKESIIIINKMDLIPDNKHPSEVADWVKDRLAEEGILPLDIAIVSSKNNYGINGILRKIKHFYPNGVKAMIVGVANVGKSSILNRLLGEKVATVSKYPGTTIKSTAKHIDKLGIELYDTPGIIPEGRISDLLCDSCSQKLIPANEISRKTFKVGYNRIIMIGDLLNIRILNRDELKPIFTIYASKDVPFHETNIAKYKELVEKNFFEIPCNECREKYKKNSFKKVNITVETNQELVFKGLGWITVKRGPLNIQVNLPENVDLVVREAFIDPRR